MILEYADLTNDELLALVADNPNATFMEVELMLRVGRALRRYTGGHR